MARESVPEQLSRTPLIEALQGWHAAKDAAGRYNRNVLQYAAAVAAVFGIGTGASGVFVVAEAQTDTELIATWGQFVLYGLAGIGAVALLFLGWQLGRAFSRRSSAERDVGWWRDKLIAIDPKPFLPSEE